MYADVAKKTGDLGGPDGARCRWYDLYVCAGATKYSAMKCASHDS